MNRSRLSAAPLLLAVVLIAGLSGCNSKSGCTVTGQLVQDGNPFSVSGEAMPPGSRPIQIIFHALPGENGPLGESFHSEVNAETGEFTVKGPANKGIPPGKYRISVMVLSSAAGGPPRGAAAPPGVAPNPAGVMGMSDKLKGAFGLERSPLQVEITGPTRLVVDVGSKPGVSVQ